MTPFQKKDPKGHTMGATLSPHDLSSRPYVTVELPFPMNHRMINIGLDELQRRLSQASLHRAGKPHDEPAHDINGNSVVDLTFASYIDGEHNFAVRATDNRPLQPDMQYVTVRFISTSPKCEQSADISTRNQIYTALLHSARIFLEGYEGAIRILRERYPHAA